MKIARLFLGSQFDSDRKMELNQFLRKLFKLSFDHNFSITNFETFLKILFPSSYSLDVVFL